MISQLATLFVLVVSAPCPVQSTDSAAAGACAYPELGVVYVPPWDDAFAREHEVCHVADYQLLTDARRRRLERLLSWRRPVAWRSGTGLSGLRSPSERFADACAAYRLGRRPDGRWETAYDYVPTPRAFARVRRALSRYGIQCVYTMTS